MPYWKSPFEFYINKADSQPEYVTMMKAMQQHYSNAGVASAPADTPIGAYCVCRKDNIFHRAQVVRCTPSASELQFIDIGERCALRSADIFALDRRFAQLPRQAIRCCLADVIQLCDNQPIVRRLQRDVTGTTKLLVLLLGKQQPTHAAESWTETMWVDMRVGDESIRTMLIRDGLLTPVPDGKSGIVMEMF